MNTELFFSILESFSFVAGIFFIFLQVKQVSWMWHINNLCCFAALVVFAHQQLWASMGLNIYYIVVGVIGVIAWKKEKAESKAILVRKMNGITWVLSVLAFLVGFGVLFYILKITHDPAPVADALVGASGAVGMVWLLRCYIQNWAAWLFSDVISLYLCLSSGLYFMSALYLAYIIVAIVGWREWRVKGIQL